MPPAEKEGAKPGRLVVLPAVADAVRESYTNGTVVLMLGAGDIDLVVDDVVACL